MFTLLNRLIVTCFFVGNLRPGSGTWSSLFTCLIAWFLYPYLDLSQTLFVLIFAFLPLTLCLALYLRQTKQDDPSEVVIDEVYAIALILVFVDHSWLGYALAFLLFRMFDIVKIGPARWLDLYRGRWQALCVMGDDLVAALYTAIIINVMGYLYLP